MRLKCFVASAFDHKDVDEIYDKAIRPVLRSLKIRPMRVDRVEHNEDIDDKIFQFLDAADFCIADLTYARPSVYYETGYAFGTGRPVIYIARSDHFKAREDDMHGNLRMHFDLQMKNIIPWTRPSDALRKRLTRRIRHIVRRLLKQTAKSEKEIKAEAEFARMSQHNRIASVTYKARRLLKVRGYRTEDLDDRIKAVNRFRAFRFRNGVSQHIHLLCLESISKNSFGYPIMWLPLLVREDAEKAKLIDFHSIYVALRKVGSPRFESYLPRYTPTGNGVFVREDLNFLNKPFRTTIHILHGITSLDSFAARFRRELEVFKLGK